MKGLTEMKTVWRYLSRYRGRMTVGFCIKTSGTLVELLLPYILSHILKDVITRSVSDIVFWGILMIVCAAAACILNIVANRMAAKVSRDFAETMRRDLFRSTLYLSTETTDRYTVPSLEARITTDTYNVHGFVNMAQRLGVRAPILLIGGIAITLLMDARLSLVMIALLPLIFGVIMFIRFRGIPLYAGVQKSTDDMVRVVREDMQGIRVIKALSKTAFENKRYESVNRKLSKDEIRAGVVMSSINPAMNIFMNLGSVAVIALGAVFVSRGLSQPETIIAFMQYFTQISMAMMSVTRIFVMYTKCAASATRIEEVLKEKEDLPVYSESDCPPIEGDGHITFRHVSYTYVGKRNNVDDVSFSIKRGARLGIIGMTGSGKSTLVKLLLRLYDPSEGAIYIDGRDIRTVDKERYYAMFGSATQNDFLYADTVAENIRFGRDIPEEDIRRAAKIAQADDFIEKFPEGYEHLLSPHGTNISGGQKQRILIARALSAKPDVIVFDDSFSALDYKTDAALRRALSEELSDTTVITVAQRVSSIMDCDRILVMNRGRIVAEGTHDELSETSSEYREIIASQLGGAFLED